jgi:hypothetical protein
MYFKYLLLGLSIVGGTVFPVDAAINSNSPKIKQFLSKPMASQKSRPMRFSIGYNYGEYANHLSGPEIYTWRMNHGFNAMNLDKNLRILEVTDEFGSLNNFHGIIISLENGYGSDENSPIRYEFGWVNRHKTTDIKFTFDRGDNTEVIEHYEKLKIRYNSAFFGLGYRPRNGNLFFGANMDLGLFRTSRKVDSKTVEDKSWQPWFYTPKVIGNGITGMTPVVGYGFFVSYDISRFNIRLAQSYGLMNADLNSESGKYTNIPWSSKNFPIQNASLALTFNLAGRK